MGPVIRRSRDFLREEIHSGRFGLQYDVEIALGVVSANVQPLELVRFG
jgi:hypothetical protein